MERELTGGGSLMQMRMRYHGTASRWSFALHDPAGDRCQDALLPTGDSSRTPEDALDTACRLHLTGLGT
ncbi:hypothetical protein [Streptomyces sp. NPDC050528]|uniref:hypothetical protein n=1 Tax=Streptomyces sp. NPDC050528 TaxID=3365623 RepID=UPI0037987810